MMMENKKKALIATVILLALLFTWALIAVHDSAVAAARAARANKSNPLSSCPFSKAAPSTQKEDSKKKSSCCHSKTEDAVGIKTEQGHDQSEPASPANFEKMANLKEEELEEFLKQFTPEQLTKCPHLKARKTNKKK